MLIKINKKPIHVTEETESDNKDWILFTVKCTAYLMILFLMDYVCFTFFYIHPLPFIHKLATLIGSLYGRFY